MTAGVAALIVVTAVLLALTAAIDTRHRAQQAADLAALAGAAARQHGEDGCTAARRIAAANSASLTACAALGSDEIEVTVERPLPAPVARWVAGSAGAQARAGPVAVPASGSWTREVGP